MKPFLIVFFGLCKMRCKTNLNYWTNKLYNYGRENGRTGRVGERCTTTPSSHSVCNTTYASASSHHSRSRSRGVITSSIISPIHCTHTVFIYWFYTICRVVVIDYVHALFLHVFLCFDTLIFSPSQFRLIRNCYTISSDVVTQRAQSFVFSSNT